MALNARKRKSAEPESYPEEAAHGDESQTPFGSPPKKKLRITQRQKQALIDNLQLEITDRARKLRAHYALQAQDLRGRIARRVNRIPMALRKVTMGELLERHNQATNAKGTTTPVFKKPALPSKATRLAPTISRDTASQNNTTVVQKQPRGVKRPSVDVNSSDKENAPSAANIHEQLSNPKKRAKAGVANASTRNASQATRQAQSKILSPKSSNSRTFPHSPLRISPEKPSQSQQFMSRPASPLKLGSPVKAGNATANLAGMIDNARARATRSTATTARKPTPQGATATASGTTSAASTRAKRTTTRATTSRAAPARPATRLQNDRRISSGTTASNTSSGTTVVKPARGATGARKTTASAAAKKATTTGAAAAKKTTAAAAKRAAPAVEQPAAGRRILRKRN